VAVYERDDGHTARVDRYGCTSIRQVCGHCALVCLPGAWRDFLATTGKPGGGFGFLSDELQTLVVVDDETMYPASNDAAEQWYPTARKALRRNLLDGLEDVVYFGKTFERYEICSDGRIIAFFADVSVTPGDVLVGADGANCPVQRQYLPQAERIDTGAVGIAPLGRSTVDHRLSRRSGWSCGTSTRTMRTPSGSSIHISTSPQGSCCGPRTTDTPAASSLRCSAATSRT
jgi:hypothetical protein